MNTNNFTFSIIYNRFILSMTKYNQSISDSNSPQLVRLTLISPKITRGKNLEYRFWRIAQSYKVLLQIEENRYYYE